jgi:hypothetical protein
MSTEDSETVRLNDRELHEFFREMFPHGFADVEVVRELAPEGWKNSPLLACFHPSPEQILAEQVQRHRTSQGLRTLRRKKPLKQTEEPASPEPTLAEVLADWEDCPVNILEEVTEIVGRCLWDVFSDNHDIVAADGRKVDIGSFRGASAFLDEYVRGSKRHGDEYRFYMGTIWISDRADLTPVYRMIFRRLNLLGANWEYDFPKLRLVDLSPLRQALEKQDETYSPSVAFAQDQEEHQRQADLEKVRKDLEEANNQARRKAAEKPPPPTVKAYQEIYGRDPKGWPPF